MSSLTELDQEKLHAFLTKFVDDFGATLHASTVLVGEKLGLYKALAASGGLNSEGLAARIHTSERYVREWLAAQASAGYVIYDPKTGLYSMSSEQAFALATKTVLRIF